MSSGERCRPSIPMIRSDGGKNEHRRLRGVDGYPDRIRGGGFCHALAALALGAGMRNKWAICLLILIACPACARDLDGRYANDPLHGWFNSLASKRGNCCSFADGRRIDDPHFDL